MFEKYIQVLRNPKAVFEREKNKTNLMEDIKLIGIAGIISGILVAISVYTINSPAPGMSDVIGIGSIVIVPIRAILGLLILSGITYIFARLFGGKGGYNSQTHLMALYTAPIIVLTTILSLIPTVGPFISVLIALYSIYLLILVLKTVHKFSTLKAIGTWLAPMIFITILFVIVLVVLTQVIFADTMIPYSRTILSVFGLA
jgi:hypothetical protein